MSERKAMLKAEQPLSLTRQCQLLAVPRSSAYARSQPVSAQDLMLMRLLDEAVLRQSTSVCGTPAAGPSSQSQTGATPDATDGTSSALPQAPNQSAGQRAPNLPIFIERPLNYASESGLGERHLLHSDGEGLSVSDGDHGLVLKASVDGAPF